MTLLVNPSRMVAFGLAIASLQGLLKPLVYDTANAQVSDHDSVATAPSDEAAITSDDSPLRSVSPTGWRRTNRGWERAEAWDNGTLAFASESGETPLLPSRYSMLGGTRPQTVGQWMIWDQAREPVWANTLLGSLKRVHPIFVAVFLIAVAIVITRLSEPTGPGTHP